MENRGSCKWLRGNAEDIGGIGVLVFDEAYNPELVKLCLRCERKDCDGGCQAYHRKRRELKGKNTPVRRTYSAMGEEHTVAEWSEITGITRDALWDGLRKGKSMESTIRDVLRYKGRAEEIRAAFGGLSMTQAAKAHGLSVTTLYNRLNSGMNPYDALHAPLKRGKRHNKGR